MGTYLSQPQLDKESSDGSGLRHSWACSSMQGWRTGQEDAHVAISDLGGENAGIALFGVLDGHGGKEVSGFCQRHFPDEVRNVLEDLHSIDTAIAKHSLFGETLTSSFERMDEMLRQPEHKRQLLALKNGADGVTTTAGYIPEGKDEVKQSPISRPASVMHQTIRSDLQQAKAKGSLSGVDATELVMKMALLKRMAGQSTVEPCAQALDAAADFVGCTAVCVLITDSEVVCANAGDSRAIMCRKGSPVELSHDHKPNDPVERRRIEAAGGRVDEITNTRTQYRINGNLNLSRAIGDLEYKRRTDLGPEQQVVSATPDIVSMPITEDDEFIVLACDGVWDVKTNEEVCDFVRQRLAAKEALPKLVEALLDDCITDDPKQRNGLGTDNMTCIVVKLTQPD